MNSFSLKYTFYVALLSAGGLAAAASGLVGPTAGGDAPGYLPRVELVRSPAPLPPPPDPILLSLGLTEVDEEDPDTVEDPVAFDGPAPRPSAARLHLSPYRVVPGRTPPGAAAVALVLRC